MAGERGSAVAAAATAVVIMLSTALLFHCQMAESTVYPVKWDLSSPVQLNGPFTAGVDKILFQYAPVAHNVVHYTNGSLSCDPDPSTVKTYQTGYDHITLEKGQNNFICSMQDHCNYGMNFSVTAN